MFNPFLFPDVVDQVTKPDGKIDRSIVINCDTASGQNDHEIVEMAKDFSKLIQLQQYLDR